MTEPLNLEERDYARGPEFEREAISDYGAARLSHDRGADAVTAAIHAAFERDRDPGCVHFDKGFGEFKLCEDPDEGVPVKVVHELVRVLSVPATTLPALDAESVIGAVSDVRFEFARFPGDGADGEDTDTGRMMTRILEVLREALRDAV